MESVTRKFHFSSTVILRGPRKETTIAATVTGSAWDRIATALSLWNLAFRRDAARIASK